MIPVIGPGRRRGRAARERLPYGLSASVFGERESAEAVAARLESGAANVNDVLVNYLASTSRWADGRNRARVSVGPRRDPQVLPHGSLVVSRFAGTKASYCGSHTRGQGPLAGRGLAVRQRPRALGRLPRMPAALAPALGCSSKGRGAGNDAGGAWAGIGRGNAARRCCRPYGSRVAPRGTRRASTRARPSRDRESASR